MTRACEAAADAVLAAARHAQDEPAASPSERRASGSLAKATVEQRQRGRQHDGDEHDDPHGVERLPVSRRPGDLPHLELGLDQQVAAAGSERRRRGIHQRRRERSGRRSGSRPGSRDDELAREAGRAEAAGRRARTRGAPAGAENAVPPRRPRSGLSLEHRLRHRRVQVRSTASGSSRSLRSRTDAYRSLGARGAAADCVLLTRPCGVSFGRLGAVVPVRASNCPRGAS